MSHTVLTFALPGAAYLALLWVIFDTAIRRLKRRARELQTANSALTEFYDTLEKILSSPIAPDNVKDTLIWFETAIGNREMSIELTKEACSRWESSNYARVDPLYEIDRELAEQVKSAYSFGTAAMMLRWPQTSRIYQNVAWRMSANRGEMIAAAKQTKTKHDTSGFTAAAAG